MKTLDKGTLYYKVRHAIQLGCRTPPRHPNPDGALRRLPPRAGPYRFVSRSAGCSGCPARLRLGVRSPQAFVAYWSGVGLVGVSAAYFMARQQAVKVGESFWSAPTRRVTQALLPPLFVGFVGGLLSACLKNDEFWPAWLVLPLWMVLYGCAVHAAAFSCHADETVWLGLHPERMFDRGMARFGAHGPWFSARACGDGRVVWSSAPGLWCLPLLHGKEEE